tara:strand:- start:212 stop:484 length:273 start_codon:yes stop_codon:yes gene_type:complete
VVEVVLLFLELVQLVVLVVEDQIKHLKQEVQGIHPLQVLHRETLAEMDLVLVQMIVVVAVVVLVLQEEMQLHPKQEMVEQEQQTILQEVV